MLKPKVGQWVRVKFDDVGARDGICISRDGNRVSFLECFGDGPQNIEISQIVSLGRILEAKDSGL